MNRRELLGGAMAAAVFSAIGAEAASDPPFGLGTVTYNVCKDWDLPTLLDLLPKAGVYAVEFRTTHAHGVEPALSPDQRLEVKQRCHDAGMKQWSLGSVLEFQSADAAVVRKNIDSCAEWVKLAQDIGALAVKIRPNGLPTGAPVPQTLEQIGKSLVECGKMAADHGVEIWVEVHGSGTQEPANMRTIMDHCGHKSVGINWNSNPTDVKNGSVKEAFDLLKPQLMSCHINTLTSGYPYRELFALMREANFRRYTNCEVATAVKAEDGLAFYRKYKEDWLALARG
jgi:sugar phosphate isomerase/epimerase